MGEHATAAARAGGYTDTGGGGIRVKSTGSFVTLAFRPRSPRTRSAASKGGCLQPSRQRKRCSQTRHTKDRAKGAFGALNRAGLHEVSEEQHAQEVMLTGTEKIAKIREPAATLTCNACSFYVL